MGLIDMETDMHTYGRSQPLSMNISFISSSKDYLSVLCLMWNDKVATAVRG